MNPGDQLERMVSEAEESVLLIAPFVKADTLSRLTGAIRPGVAVTLHTRWRVHEIAMGVSDLEAWDVLRGVAGASLWLCGPLHAKLYATEKQVMLGSANLTASALGWTPTPNLELMVDYDCGSEALAEFRVRLSAASVLATAELREAMAALVEEAKKLLPPSPPEPGIEEAPIVWGSAAPSDWFPQLQEPSDLRVAYGGGFNELTRRSQEAARADLAALELPSGLDPRLLRSVVAGQLLQTPLVAAIDGLLAQPKRFGAVVDLIQVETGLPREQAKHAWQGIMRWLLYFLPERYERWVDRHTEMFCRVPP